MLATVQALQEYIGKPGTSSLCLIGLLDAAEEFIVAHCQRSFGLSETTDYLDGAGTPELVLSRRPVTELYAVFVAPDDRPDLFSLLSSGEITLHAESGIIERVGSVFPRGTRNIKVGYAAGYSVIPEDLALACVKLAAQLYLVSDLSAETEALVAPYKERVLA